MGDWGPYLGWGAVAGLAIVAAAVLIAVMFHKEQTTPKGQTLGSNGWVIAVLALAVVACIAGLLALQHYPFDE